MSNAQSMSGELPSAPELSSSLRRTMTGLALARGALLLVIGIVLLVWPEATLTVASVLIGLQLVLVGIIRFVLLFTEAAGGWVKALQGMLGVLMILAGVVCIKAPLASVLVLLVILALGWLMDAIISFVGAIRPFDGWGMLYAAVSLLAAIAVLVWPSIALATFVAVAAVFLIILGVVQLVVAWRARST
jgi:uncharacterized membrane protein HdeD (DUF308 family)